MGSLPHFFTHGAPLRASRARAPLSVFRLVGRRFCFILCNDFQTSLLLTKKIPTSREFDWSAFVGLDKTDGGTSRSKLSSGPITATGYSGEAHFSSRHVIGTLYFRNLVKRVGFVKNVFWGTRFGCIWSGKALILRKHLVFSDCMGKLWQLANFTCLFRCSEQWCTAPACVLPCPFLQQLKLWGRQIVEIGRNRAQKCEEKKRNTTSKEGKKN